MNTTVPSIHIFYLQEVAFYQRMWHKLLQAQFGSGILMFNVKCLCFSLVCITEYKRGVVGWQGNSHFMIKQESTIYVLFHIIITVQCGCHLHVLHVN